MRMTAKLAEMVMDVVIAASLLAVCLIGAVRRIIQSVMFSKLYSINETVVFCLSFRHLVLDAEHATAIALYSVCLSVCLSSCLSVCMSISSIFTLHCI